MHAAVVAHMRFCVRLAHREGALNMILPSLEPALPALPAASLEQASAGVLAPESEHLLARAC